MQRNLALFSAFSSCHFSAVQATGNADLDSLCSRSHGSHDRLARGSLEGNSLLDLLRDGFGNELPVDIWASYFLHVHMHLLAGHSFKEQTKIIDSLAAASDDNTGSGAVQGNFDSIRCALDLNRRNCGSRHLLLCIPAYSSILYERSGVSLIEIPLAVPIANDSNSETYRMNLLTHLATLFP